MLAEVLSQECGKMVNGMADLSTFQLIFLGIFAGLVVLGIVTPWLSLLDLKNLGMIARELEAIRKILERKM